MGRFILGVGNSFERVHRKFVVARYLKHSQGEMKHAPRCFEALKQLYAQTCPIRPVRKKETTPLVANSSQLENTAGWPDSF